MKIIKNFIIIFIISIYPINTYSSEIFFIDMKVILNKSKAGKQAQDFLKKIIG